MHFRRRQEKFHDEDETVNGRRPPIIQYTQERPPAWTKRSFPGGNNVSITWSRHPTDRQTHLAQFCRLIMDGKRVCTHQTQQQQGSINIHFQTLTYWHYYLILGLYFISVLNCLYRGIFIWCPLWARHNSGSAVVKHAAGWVREAARWIREGPEQAQSGHPDMESSCMNKWRQWF